MKNQNKGTKKNSTVPQTLYMFRAKTQKRLLEVSKFMRFYEMWKGLTNQKKESQPEVPKITRELHVMYWTNDFDNFLHRKISVSTIPLSYVTRITALATRPASLNKDYLPNGEEFESIEDENFTQASHTHPIYCKDHAAVYYCLEEAVRGT
eukprot:14404458-Ditylum_brightwellii.AAC.1